MIRRTPAPLFCSALLILYAACSQPGGPPANIHADSEGQTQTATGAPAISSSTDVVKVSSAPVEITAGGSADASVRLSITSGYHVNANPPTFSYLKPTEVNVEAGEGLSAGKPDYPASVTKKFSFSEKPLAVYEGEVEIKVTVRAAPNATKGAHTLRARVSVQACDDKACYRPGA
ncbi:MAG TPA: protein-disulfide reductase DsbD domain-containing protein, partial [Pyrinomonadaceae bacterium]